jgi:hypothetical protein
MTGAIIDAFAKDTIRTSHPNVPAAVAVGVLNGIQGFQLEERKLTGWC